MLIDIDRNDDTGFWLNEAGYYPASGGYDVLAELEYVGDRFVSGKYSNHGIKTRKLAKLALVEQSKHEYLENNNGPYPAGFLRLGAGRYPHSTAWVYHDNDTLTFIKDGGPRLGGIVTAELSPDGRELEARFPYIGFLKDETGKPILGIGSEVDISFTLEASGELTPRNTWASDTGSVIRNYKLTAMEKN